MLEQFRPRFEAANTQVLAINPASAASHRNYAGKKGFNFPILSDPTGSAVRAFGCQKPDGKGVLRTVYALDPQGSIVFAERGHADYVKVLETIQSLSG